ncbi:MAG: hypothetical protein MJK14_08970 [Rivularia sp. ALOHA_DT_140]|nr:hypothetical protein [Rivularia sp. ALOHA_DT_140]
MITDNNSHQKDKNVSALRVDELAQEIKTLCNVRLKNIQDSETLAYINSLPECEHDLNFQLYQIRIALETVHAMVNDYYKKHQENQEKA